MSNHVEIEKLDGKVALFKINSSINVNSEEAADFINTIMDEMEKDGYVKYIFDLQRLNLANSRFIGLIARRHYCLKEKGGQLIVLKTQDMVKKSFEMSGLSDMLTFHDDREEAIKSFIE